MLVALSTVHSYSRCHYLKICKKNFVKRAFQKYLKYTANRNWQLMFSSINDPMMGF